MQSYILVGAGGTGSLLYRPLVHYLLAYHRNQQTPFSVAVIDGDKVEHKNLDRQLYTGANVEQNKATALVESLQIGGLTAYAIEEYLGEANLDLIDEGDIVLIAADNYKVRAWIEKRALQLDKVTVVNGGNETTEGSLQVWMRRAGQNVTPPLSWDHPEITDPTAPDRATMTCEAAMNLPGSEQTIMANMASATHMLNAIAMVHSADLNDDSIPWSEQHFDLITGKARAFDHSKRAAEFATA